MFATLTSRLFLGVYVFIILAIPAGSYFIAQSRTAVKSNQEAQKTTKTTVKVASKPTISPSKDLLEAARAALGSVVSPTPSSGASPEIAKSFGPTLSFTATLEGRPQNNQANKMFVGITEGVLSANPKFLLSFTVDLPASGSYSNLSLAGLNPGSSYTALLKGSAQIATSSAFTLSPTVTSLNSSQPVNLLSGDLNEDNMINSADYSIAQKASGSTGKSSNWNGNADLNKDGVINAFDLGIIAKNMGKIGASGAWVSPIPKTATPSAGLNNPPVGSPNNESGHWIWVPNLTN